VSAPTPRATGWVAHLRAGGTTPWAAFGAEAGVSTGSTSGGSTSGVSTGSTSGGSTSAGSTSGGSTSGGSTSGAWTPGAQQLEVLRRLNELGRPGPALVERVLAADLVGRGRGDLGLVGEPQRRFGTPPVDPADLPTPELLRVVTGLLAEDVVRAGTPTPPAPRRPRWRRVRYRLHGDPWLAVPMREELTRHGYPPGGGRAVTYLIGRDLGSMLVDAWTRRALVDGAAPWPLWLKKLHRADRIPPRADLLRQARWWADRVGADRVRIVTDPALVPDILGVDMPLPAPPVLAADALELARRVSPLVGLFAGPGHREQLMRHGLLPRLAAVPGEPVGVPAPYRGWVEERAAAVHRDLLRGDYAVLGDPALVLGPPPAGVSPSERSVLVLAMRTLLENDPESRTQSVAEGA